MRDVVEAVRDYLAADAGVAALTTRVHGGSLPAEETDSMPRLNAVVVPAGGRFLADWSNRADARLDIRAYGFDELEAWRLNGAVVDAMQRLTRTVVATSGGSTTLHNATSESIGSRQQEAAPRDWPFFLSTWVVAFITAAQS